MKKALTLIAALVLLALPAAAKNNGPVLGSFPACYYISSFEPGAPVLNVRMLVNMPTRTVTGESTVSNASLGNMVTSNIRGTVTPYPSEADPQVWMVNITGWPQVSWPKGGGIGPILLSNLKASFSVLPNWQKGTSGSYAYRSGSLEWTKISGAQVKGYKCFGK